MSTGSNSLDPDISDTSQSACTCTCALSPSFAIFSLTCIFICRSQREVCMCVWTHSWGLGENTWRDTIAKQDRVCTCTSNDTSKRYVPPRSRNSASFQQSRIYKVSKRLLIQQICFFKTTLGLLQHLLFIGVWRMFAWIHSKIQFMLFVLILTLKIV